MKRRDFVNLFAKVPVALGAATALSSVKAAEPVIDILVPDREIILPTADNEDNILYLSNFVRVNWHESNNLSQHQTHGRDTIITAGALEAHVEVQVYLYNGILTELINHKIEYFEFAINFHDYKHYGDLNGMNGSRFRLATYEIVASFGSHTTVKLTGLKVK